MKNNIVRNRRFYAYLVCISVATILGMAWKFKLLMPAALVFMSNYGAHTLSAYLMVVMFAFVVQITVPPLPNKLLLSACIGMLLISWTDEYLQQFDPGRVSDIWDCVAALIGTILAYASVRIIGPLQYADESENSTTVY